MSTVVNCLGQLPFVSCQLLIYTGHMLSVASFLILICLSMLFEGTGVKYGREIAMYLIIALPLTFIFSKNWTSELSGRLKNLFILFLAVSILSAVFSENPQNSAKYLLLYLSVLFSFAFVLKEKKEIGKYAVPIIFSFSIFFSLYSILLPLLFKSYPILYPNGGYQFVFSAFGSHNHLGDFLVLPLLICFYNLFPKGLKIYNLRYLIYNLFILFFLPFFLFSYSRSSYIALFAAITLMIFYFIRNHALKISPARTSVAVFVLFVVALFMFSVVRNPNRTAFSNLTSTLTTQNNLSFKSSYGNRFEYLRQAGLSILEKPILGVGPGNFTAASIKFMRDKYGGTESAHNIFVDVFVENGILAGFLFILIMFEIIRKSERNLYFYLALALILNFQTDYTHRIYSLLLLFFLLLALSYSKQSHPPIFPKSQRGIFFLNR